MVMHCDVKAIDRAAKAIGIIQRICEVLEGETSYSEGGKHNRKSFAKECSLIDELIEQNVFVEHGERSHASFKSMRAVLQQCPSKKLLSLTVKRLKTYQL